MTRGQFYLGAGIWKVRVKVGLEVLTQQKLGVRPQTTTFHILLLNKQQLGMVLLTQQQLLLQTHHLQLLLMRVERIEEEGYQIGFNHQEMSYRSYGMVVLT
jgi:hypothetical protein